MPVKSEQIECLKFRESLDKTIRDNELLKVDYKYDLGRKEVADDSRELLKHLQVIIKKHTDADEMTPLKNKFDSLNLDRNFLELVRFEYATRKYFVYIDHIDELKHNSTVIKPFDNSQRIIEGLINKPKFLRTI